jgi:uncharacterized membrane protein
MPIIEEVTPQRNASDSSMVGYCMDTVLNSKDLISTWSLILGGVLIMIGLCVLRIRSQRKLKQTKEADARRERIAKVISKKLDKTS